MSITAQHSINWIEHGYIPDSIIRICISRVLKVRTRDIAAEDIEQATELKHQFIEHMRNWQQLFTYVAQWLYKDGLFFMHVFNHHNVPYVFETKDNSDWVSEYFFTGDIMPFKSLYLIFIFQSLVQCEMNQNSKVV